MKQLGIFIGVTRYADPDISDLPCASRDATALWALFTDSRPDMACSLFTDETATADAVRTALSNALLTADTDDTIVITFSGHGSYDQAVVLHDSQLSDLDTTCISTSELAKLFTRSPAKSILLILDCCFSGSTPARVVGIPAKARALLSPLRALYGTGRAIISASAEDEEAYESALLGHGILTNALIEVLTEQPVAAPLSQVFGLVAERVRTSAARIRKAQTPVFLLHMEGGLMIEPLQRGAYYAAHFPNAAEVQISEAIRELRVFGFSDAVLDAWQIRFPSGLNQLQVDAVNDGGLLRGSPLLVVAPTSSGKTFIGELAAVRAAADNRKAVFLVPYRALADEQFEQFERAYGPVGLRVIRCTGDFTDQVGPFLAGKFDIAVLTYEMFLATVTGSRWLLDRLGLVVVDEAHFIGDPRRGIVVELILTILREAREAGACPQLVALSAVVDDLAGFDTWLGARPIVRAERPVPLREGVLDRSGQWVCRDACGNPVPETVLQPVEIIQRREEPSSQDVIVPLVRKLVSQGDKVLIFRNTRGSAQGCAAYLAEDLNLPPVHAALAEWPDHDPTSASETMVHCLQGGTAFHSTNLSAAERRIVEAHFRDPEGPLRVLVATTTVAAGVNLPAENVVIVENAFRGKPPSPFTVAAYKNMAGRAGRMGLSAEGRSFLLAGTPHEAERLFRHYVTGRLEPVRSSFTEADLERWLVRLLMAVELIPADDVSSLLVNTFGGFQATRADPGWPDAAKARVSAVLQEMRDLGLIEEEGADVRLSLLGRACGASSLSFRSSMSLVDTIRRLGAVPAVGLMVLCQVLPELDGLYTPILRKGMTERVWTAECGTVWGQAPLYLQHGASDTWAYFARCKRASILGSWISGEPLASIESRYTKNSYNAVEAGFVRSCADNTRFVLRDAYNIAATVEPTLAAIADEVDSLLLRLELGLPSDLLALATLPIRPTRGETLALAEADIRTPEQLLVARESDVLRLLGPSKGRAYKRWKEG